MGSPTAISHWFSFRDSCVSVNEYQAGSLGDSLKPSLFFLHGRFGDSKTWEPLIHQLAQQFRCLALDFPGFGKSFSAEDRPFSALEYGILVSELLKKLTRPQEPSILVGHDTGGAIAQLCALTNRKKVSSLVLINSACLTQHLAKIGSFAWAARWKLKRLIAQASFMRKDYRISLLKSWDSRLSRKVLLKCFKTLDESWPWHYEQQTWKKELKSLDRPILLLWGKNDVLNPPELGMEMVQRVPEAYFFMHEKAGHWPCLEQPDWVITKMREFIFRTGIGSTLGSASLRYGKKAGGGGT